MSVRARNTRLTLQTRSASVDAEGNAADTWTTVATVYGDVRYLRGLEALKGGAEVSVVQASVNIAPRADVTAGCRLLDGATVFDIQSVLPTKDRRGLDLACKVIA